MTDSKASEVEKARRNVVQCEAHIHHPKTAVKLCLHKPLCLDALIAAVSAEQQGGHVANCRCCVKPQKWGGDVTDADEILPVCKGHDHPYRDPRCGKPHVCAGHVARCVCHDADECEEGTLKGPCWNNHPHVDPRCGESIELIKAKARLEGIDSVYDKLTLHTTYDEKNSGSIENVDGHRCALNMAEKVRDEARAEVEKLEKKK